MRYRSTRSAVGSAQSAHTAESKSFTEILLTGLAPDGGLYLPEAYPQISRAELDQWRALSDSYADLAYVILAKFIDDIPAAELKALVDKTYRAEVFCHARPGDQARDITPLRWLLPPNPAQGEGGLALLELSNGPTLAFKDMAMQLLGNLFEYVLHRDQAEINILGATSGDTGSAAEYALRGKQGVRVFMLSPEGRMSAFQRAQMYSLTDENIYNIAVRGTFDEAQDVVKAVSNDLHFKVRYKIGAVNSINWARVLAQIVYYFKGYFAASGGVQGSNDQQVAFAVPSGNFGNICAGHIARMMGLPISRLVMATNENDVLDEFFRRGVYRPRSAAETQMTSSPSMDISKASNFERFIFDLVGRDPQVVRTLWSAIDSGSDEGFDLSATPYFAKLSQFAFVSGKSRHADRLATIRDTLKQYGIMDDPHTADGLKVAAEWRDPALPMVVLETALPIKFEATLREALGRPPECPAALRGIEQLPQRVVTLDADVAAVKQFLQDSLD
ncbi:MAG: threonine synthase [Pseudomonadota bacterium]